MVVIIQKMRNLHFSHSLENFLRDVAHEHISAVPVDIVNNLSLCLLFGATTAAKSPGKYLLYQSRSGLTSRLYLTDPTLLLWPISLH